MLKVNFSDTLVVSRLCDRHPLQLVYQILRFFLRRINDIIFIDYYPQGNMKRIFHELTYTAKVN